MTYSDDLRAELEAVQAQYDKKWRSQPPPVSAEREPRKIEDYRADRAYLDEDEAQLLEAWDALKAELQAAQERESFWKRGLDLKNEDCGSFAGYLSRARKRGEQLESELQAAQERETRLRSDYWAERQEREAAEEREKALREALAEACFEWEAWMNKGLDVEEPQPDDRAAYERISALAAQRTEEAGE